MFGVTIRAEFCDIATCGLELSSPALEDVRMGLFEEMALSPNNCPPLNKEGLQGGETELRG